MQILEKSKKIICLLHSLHFTVKLSVPELQVDGRQMQFQKKCLTIFQIKKKVRV